jgi:predicted dehydrogenase
MYEPVLSAQTADTISNRLNIGFIGGAYHSAVGRVHRIATEMDQRFRVTAGCFSRNEVRNSESAELYGIQRHHCHDSLDELLANELAHLDAIVILTPTNQHFEAIEQCLSLGVPVISEKALVANVHHAQLIKQQLSKKNGFLRVTYNYTGYPMLRELKAMIALGKLGKVNEIHIEMPQEGFAKKDVSGNPIVPQSWRLQDGDIPTLALDLGVHVHSIIHFLTGSKPLAVCASNHTYGNFSQITDSISCIAEYSHELSAHIWFSKTALGQRNGLRVRVYGDAGSAEWLQEQPETVCYSDINGRRYVLDRAHPEVTITQQSRYNRFKSGHPAGFIEAFANAYYDLAEDLNAYRQGALCENPYTFGIDEALEGLQMLTAMQESHLRRQWIDIHCDA